jgi:integrase/recombinase XerD
MSEPAQKALLYLLDGERGELAVQVEAWTGTLDSPRTRVTYRHAVMFAFGVMRRDNPRHVTPADVAALKQAQDGRASATVALRLSALRSFFRYLVVTGYLSADPTEAVRIPRVHAAAPRALTLDQAKRICAAIDLAKVNGLRDATAIALLFSGLRVAEVAGINVGDVTLEEQEGRAFTRVRVVGKGNKPRDVDLPPRIYELVIRYIEARGGPCDAAMPLFLATATGYRDQPGRMSPHRIYCQLRRYARKARVKITGSHAGRHTWARLAEDGGAKMVDISAHLGHASLAVTATYLRRLAGKRNPASDVVPVVI